MTPKRKQGKVWRRGLGDRLRFDFTEKSLKNKLSKLESLNNSLVLLSNQTKRSITSTEKTATRRSDMTKMHIQRYHIVGQVSRQVYKTLSRACTKHTEHLAQFGVEGEKVDFRGELFAQVKFNMAYIHRSMDHVTANCKPIWFLVDSVLDERVNESINKVGNSVQAGILSLKREGNSASKTAKRIKRVRFDVVETPPAPSPIPRIVINTESHGIYRGRDLCDYLRQCLCLPLRKNACVVLEHTGQCKHFVLHSTLTACAESRQALSLGQLFRPEVPLNSVQGVVNSIPVHARIKVARILAVTVL